MTSLIPKSALDADGRLTTSGHLVRLNVTPDLVLDVARWWVEDDNGRLVLRKAEEPTDA